MKYLFLLVAVFGLTSCSEHAESGHWSYSGEDGPEHWAALDASFELCGVGESQSPINLSGFEDVELPVLGLQYGAGGYAVLNNGHTIQVNVEAGSTLTIENHLYELKQFHFHSPSENTVEGEAFPLEMHLVHADEQGALAVLAVMFETGDPNTVLASIWSQMPPAADETAELAVRVNPIDLLPPSRDYYRFDGSLTTPPCSEGVVWLVLAEPVQASEDQVNALLTTLGHSNARPVQELNGRTVLK